MNRKAVVAFSVLILGFGGLYLGGLASVPFHPDETSHIYTSRDFELLWRNPAALIWTPGQPLTQLVSLRLLNSPLTRYMMGFSLWLQGYSATDLNSDWDWSQSWGANLRAGHQPSPGMLLAARLSVTVLTVLAIGLLFWIGNEVAGLGAGVIAALFFGLHPLLLFHGRHAMTESALLFFSLAAILGTIYLAKRLTKESRAPTPTWRGALLNCVLPAALTGVLVGLALASKQSALPLLPTALGASLTALFAARAGLARKIRLAYLALVSVLLSAGCVFTFYLLNPILYRQPLTVAQIMLEARTRLTQGQTRTVATLLPASLTPSVAARLRAALLELYLRPPAVWDIPVYVEQLEPQLEAYLAFPLHRPWAGPLGGALLAGLGVAGCLFGALRLIRTVGSATWPAEQTVWWWTAGAWGMILVATPFDWQRYFLPLLPGACLWAALGLVDLLRPLARRGFKV